MLRGVGACIALPLLDAMLPNQSLAASNFQPLGESTAAHPRMMCCYVPQGVNIYDWFPKDEGRDWTLTPTLEALAEFKSDFTLFSGLGHPNGPGGHQGDETWLTAADLDGTPGKDYQNNISIDQIAARLHGRETRFPSIELSSKGGAETLAFDAFGTPLPAEMQPPRLFERLFVPEGEASRQATLRRYAERSSVLDVVLGDARSLERRLGKADREKLQEYLGSVRETERRIDRSRNWVDVPRPEVDDVDLQLSANWYELRDRERWLDVMLELSYLAFQTDSTRVITYQWSSEPGFHHSISHHGGDPDMLRQIAEVDRFYVARLARFLGLLKATKEGEGNMLDNTMVLYGSGMNNGEGGGHSPKNLPLLFAGGKNLGIRQGQHLKFDIDSTPMSNLLLVLLQKMGVEQDTFMDSTGALTGLV
jgi:hypothetical protein